MIALFPLPQQGTSGEVISSASNGGGDGGDR